MQNISNKFSRNKIENEKNDIYMEIENAQIKKANLLLDMGIMTYEKIRNEIIIDDSFDNISNEILEIDKLIYNNNYCKLTSNFLFPFPSRSQTFF